MALMSGKVYSNTGAPNNADGVDGDIYMQLNGSKTTYRKESGAWVAIGSSLGAIPEVISGVGAPSGVLGTDEQYYRDTETQDIYYKQGSTWNLVGNLQGASFIPILQQAGIGKDLGTSPNLLDSGSLDTIIGVGEYYYTADVTDTPYSTGFLKVWRKDSDQVQQWVQSDAINGKVAHRVTSDGGSTWSSWVTYALSTGSASVDFKVSGGTTANSAISYAQLISGALHNNHWDVIGGEDRFFDIPIAADKVFRVAMNIYGGTASNGTVTFTNAFDVFIGVWPSAIYNNNITDGGAALTHIKSGTTSGFDFTSGIESEAVDTFNAAALPFYWVAVGIVNL